MSNKYLCYVFFCLLLSACGEQLISDLTTAVENLKQVIIQTTHQGTASEDGTLPHYSLGDGTKQFNNDLGVQIHLEKAAIAWGHLELISEGSDEECEAGHNVHLHLEHVENLMSEDGVALVLEQANIEDHAYCIYQLELGTDNAESPGVDDVPEMADASVYVMGHWENGTESGNFEITISEELSVEKEFSHTDADGNAMAHPFHYHAGQISKSIQFHSVYDQWFDGITFAESEAELSAKLQANVLASIEL